MAKIFIINDASITAGADTASDLGTSSVRWGSGWIANLLTVGTVSAIGNIVGSASLTISTGTIIAAKITATTGSFTALLTAGTASISGAIIGGTSVTAGTGSFSGAIIGGTTLTVGTVSATGNAIIAGTVSAAITIVADSAYGSDWNGSTAVPTRNVVFDKIESLTSLAFGTYTPTLTNIVNVASSSAYSCQFLQVGSVVTVSGRVDIDPDLTLTASSLDISLPVASTFTSANHCGGAGCSPGISGQVVAILANTVSAVAQMQWRASDVTNQATFFSFTYRIV